MNQLIGTTRIDLDINDIRAHSISRTLADEPVRYGGAILVDFAIAKVAHEMDRNPRDFEVSYHDFDRLAGDALSWWVEVGWWIGCNYCEYPAVEQSHFDDDLCAVHYDEAGRQAQADLENDDIALGLR
jgi:hypothetical protein